MHLVVKNVCVEDITGNMKIRFFKSVIYSSSLTRTVRKERYGSI